MPDWFSGPQEIVNAFGMNDNDIVGHFLQLGYKFLVDPNTAESCTKLFMFARCQTLNMRITPDPDQQIIPRQMGKSYNQSFNKTSTLSQIKSFLQSQDRI